MAGKILLTASMLIWTLLGSLPVANAGLVFVGFTADITSISDGTPNGFLEKRIKVGDLITGVYIYDLSSPDLQPSPDMGYYEFDAPPCGITLTVGGLVFMTDPENVGFSIEIRNDSPLVSGIIDSFELESRKNLPLENGFPVDYISLKLIDSSISALSSDALQTNAPVLDNWEMESIRIYGWWDRDEGFGFDMVGSLTSAVVIPEPATIWLIGLSGLALIRKHKR